MRVDIGNGFSRKLCIAQRKLHGESHGFGRWLRHVRTVRVAAKAYYLRMNPGPACNRVFILFKDQGRRAFTDHETIAGDIEGTWREMRLVVARTRGIKRVEHGDGGPGQFF